MKNLDIRTALKEAHLKQWQLADLLHISEFTLIRRMRKELPDSEKTKIMELIKANSQKGIA